MIKPEELRLGNYVMYNGSPAIVSGINSPAPRKDKNFDGKYVIELVLDGLVDCTPEELEPLPLTEEILLKSGFEKSGEFHVYTLETEGSSYLMDDCLGNYSIGADFVGWEEEGTAFFAHDIQHVHHFQNLMHTLIGGELSYGTRTKR